jgi:FAD/FMN-containing dehydrogenase
MPDAFRDRFHGEIIEPAHPNYDGARRVWNGMIDRRPALIARCADSEDVVSAIGFAREQDLIVAVRCGGHSVGGFSTCDGGIVIDLSRMRGARANPETRVVRVNGGSLLGDVDRATQEFEMACPVGVVSHTGVAGLTLGGGMGRLQRKYGLTIDNLLSVDLVTADGKLIHASEQENPDLFWGMRGAGANFGVVTSFEFRLHPVGPMVTQGYSVYSIDRAREIAARFAEFALAAPDEVMPTLAFTRVGPEDPWPELEGRPVAMMQVTHCGKLEDAERDLLPVRIARSLGGTIEPKPYLSVQGANDEALAWGKRFHMKGGFVEEITDEVVELCLQGMTAAPDGCGIGFWGQGGAIARVPSGAMAFTGREAAFWVGVESFWEDPARDEEYIGWGRRTWKALEPFTAAGHYVNDMIETGADIVRSIYGEDKYARLVELKRAYDPDNVFRLNQNILP